MRKRSVALTFLAATLCASLGWLVSAAPEAGHAPNFLYIDQNGNLHLNGAYLNAGDGTNPSLILESYADALTAFAGGGQASALALTAQTNRITTVASVDDSVKLPVSQPGLEVTVVNAGANPMRVFGAGTDTINGVATATGIRQMPNSVEIFACPVAGVWVVDSGMGFAGQLPTEIYQDTITAFAGGGQASATLLAAENNRITTVATIGDSVKLPASAAGMSIVVVNHGANAMQVYGSGTDTVDDVATATGVAQMNGSVALYYCVTAGAWYSNGIGTGFSGSFPTVSYTDNMTAHAGGGQGAATPITTAMARFVTVATAADSALLPTSAGGLQIVVINAHATNSMNVFPQTGDAINALGANAAFAVAAGKVATFYCTVAGKWHTILSARREGRAGRLRLLCRRDLYRGRDAADEWHTILSLAA